MQEGAAAALIKQAYSRMFSLLFIAFFLLCAGCDGTPSSVTPAPPATAAPTPDTTFTPARTPAGIATPTPSPSPDGYDSTELDDIAAPGETLPAYASYEEARQASIDARGGTCEVVGWITIPNTVIDYPVYLNETDEAYYLDHNSEGEVSKYGAIFMDTRNADSTQQQHVLIYGHDMRNGTMFHDLANYKQKAFFDENRYITLLWNDVETIWQVYLATPITDYTVRFTWTRFQSGDHFAEFMADMKSYARMVSSSIIDESIVIGPNDQVLTLSTCTYRPPEAREQCFVVQARRIR